MTAQLAMATPLNEQLWGRTAPAGTSVWPGTYRDPVAVTAVLALHQLGRDTDFITQATGLGEDTQRLIISGRLEQAKKIKTALKKAKVNI